MTSLYCCVVLAAALYGNGTYFAIKAEYSAKPTYSKADPNSGHQFMYLARVLTGDYTQGLKDMKAPPPKSDASAHLYDSVTDNPDDPTMFIVFHDSQAYPEYLITFK